MGRISNPFHEAALQSRLDQLYLDGQTTIAWEELYLWFGVLKIAAGTYRDVFRRWQTFADEKQLTAKASDIKVYFKKQQGVHAAIFRREISHLESSRLSELAGE